MANEPKWKGGKCRVPMWMAGVPAGFCDEHGFGPQLPLEVLSHDRGWNDSPYCHGPCCPKHGGPKAGDPILFTDGLTSEGRPMWCAVMPDFENLQESPAGYSGNPLEAIAELRAAIAKEPKCLRCEDRSTDRDFNGYCPTCHDDMTQRARGD